MTNFLDTLDFLSPEQRAVLEDEELTTASAFAHVTVETLRALGFKLGRASAILEAAGAGRPGNAGGPSTVIVQQAEPPELEARIDAAMKRARADVSKAGALADLGIGLVVLEADDKLDIAKTKDLQAHLAAGAPLPDTWHGQRIARTRELSTPPLWCVPRTGVPLQAGKDGATDIPWGELLLDGLRLAAFGIESGYFSGLADEVIFERLKANTGGVRETLTKRAKNVGIDLVTMDRRVVWRAPQQPDVSRRPPAQPAKLRHGHVVGNLSDLFTRMFNDEELRRFIRFLPDGAELHMSLPSGGSFAQLAHASAEALQRRGCIDVDLRNRIVAACPNWAAEIDAVFRHAGVIE